MAHVGRNEPCPCGSGRKYKKCCGSAAAASVGQSADREVGERHRFNLKGKKAEAVVHALAERTFFTDWCFPNPRWPDKGKNEVCDLLVHFGDVAILWTVADLTVRADGQYDPEGVAHNVRQLGGASRHLFDLRRKIQLQNVKRKVEDFDTTTIKRVFLISVVMGEGEQYSNLYDDARGRPVHVVTGASLPIMMEELNTVADFVAYLEAKERLFKGRETRILLQGGEEELLAAYLTMGRSFKKFRGKDRIVIDAGSWALFDKRPEVIAKRREDAKFSEGWDALIEIAYSMTDVEDTTRERIARELAKPNRFYRRCLAKTMLEGLMAAGEGLTPTKVQRNITQFPGTTVYIQYTHPQMDPELRDRVLEFGKWVARDLRPRNKTVIGISFTMDGDRPYVARLGYFHVPRWTAHYKSEARRVQQACGIFTEPKWRKVREDEYPSA